MKRANRKRKADRYERVFGPKADYVRGAPCIVCGGYPSDPHHVTSRGAGGTAEDLVPLCRRHHDEGHANGWQTFAAEYGVDLKTEAERIEAEYQARKHEYVGKDLAF